MTDELTHDDIKTALELSVRVGGRSREVRLAIPTVGEVLPDVCEPDARLADDLPFLVLGLIDKLDGDTPGLADAQAICAEPNALRTLLTARNRLWGDLRMQGTLFAQCPHCKEREGRFSLPTMAAVLRRAPPPIFEPHGAFVEIPVLADPHRPGERLSVVPQTTRLGVELPSGRLAIAPVAREAVLRDIDNDLEGGVELEGAAWKRWAPTDTTPPAERSHWRYLSPGFRATLRLTVGLRSLDSKDALTPENIEALSIADFLFLDAAYFLTHYVDQPSAAALVTACASCGGEYVPLR
jgi:hypothetical protein